MREINIRTEDFFDRADALGFWKFSVTWHDLRNSAVLTICSMIPLKRCAGKAVELLLDKGNTRQRRRAFRVGIELLDSPDSRLRAECEELLLGHFDSGHELIEEAIKRRRIKGESEENFQPREPTLAILLRIYRKGSELNDGPEL